MPRKPRPLIQNGLYHVYNRSNNRRSINFTDSTYDYFLTLLRYLSEKYFIKFYAYCLMKNHYHLLLETQEPNLDTAMQYFGEKYARYINKITAGSGPAFCGRYKSKIINDDTYFLQVLRYIHLNPVDVGLVETFYTYKWSSGAEYFSHTPSIVHTSFTLEKFIDLNDFVAYHQLGNSEEILKFYSRQNSSNIIHLNSF